MSCPNSPHWLADSVEGAESSDLDIEDLVTEIMDRHPHLLDQEDDMEQLAPYKSAMPTTPAPVLHRGPAAAKPVIHIPSALHGQNAASPSSPRPSTRLLSLSLHPPDRQEPSHQESAPRQAIPKVYADKHPTLSKQLRPHREPEPHKLYTSHQSRQRYQSRRSNSAQHDHGLSRQRSEQGITKHHIELCQKISDLSLRDECPSQQAVSDRAPRHRSSFAEASQPAQHVEQIEGRSRRHGLSQYADFVDVPSSPQKARSYSKAAAAADIDSQADQTSSREWEDEDDEDEYEEVSADQDKRACNGNEPRISTDQDLKYTSLVWAESSAKMMYLCTRKMYEVMWTSQTAQKLRRSAVHSTKSATDQAAESLGRLVVGSYRQPLGLVKHYVSRRCSALKASRWSPREAARCSVIRAVRLSRMRIAKVAAPILGFRDEIPISDIEDNWDFCDKVEDDVSEDANVSSVDAYGNEGWDAPGLFEDHESS